MNRIDSLWEVKRRTVLVIFISVLSIIFYSIISVSGQSSTPHSIVGKGEISCLDCHLNTYLTMINSTHSRNIVSGLQDSDVSQYDSNVCLTCHMHRERWSKFGMTDWAVFYQDENKTFYPDQWVALGFSQVLFPYGEGFSSPWENETMSASSWIYISVNSTSSGAGLRANVSFFDYSMNNTDVLSFLTEFPSGFYYTNITGIYPDYFKIGLLANFNITANNIVIISDGFMYEAASIDKIVYNITNTNYTAIANIVWDSYNQIWNRSYYPDDWNFHTGQYSNIVRMDEVWDQIREISQTSFPTQGIPIEFMGYIAENASCSATQGLCHITKSMVKFSEELNSLETETSEKHETYYDHFMTLSTNPSQTCGTCHAEYFTSGPSEHYSGQSCTISNCHLYHNIITP